jgi:hypothetical protein
VFCNVFVAAAVSLLACRSSAPPFLFFFVCAIASEACLPFVVVVVLFALSAVLEPLVYGPLGRFFFFFFFFCCQ